MKTLIKTARAAMVTMALTAGTAAFAQDITIAVVPKVAVPFFDDCNTGAQEAADRIANLPPQPGECAAEARAAFQELFRYSVDREA